jgi:hypothetical protein
MAPGHRMQPGEEPCGWRQVATLPSGVSVADTVLDDVAVWHETDALVIAHVTPVPAIVNLRLDPRWRGQAVPNLPQAEPRRERA